MMKRLPVASRELTDLFLLHVPKTGGTTLRKIIEREFDADELFELYDGIDASLERFEALGADERERIRVFLGHVRFGLHERLRPSARYVAMLRDPVERVRSLYAHQSTIKSNYLYERIVGEGIDLEGFVRDLGTIETDNFQTRMIAGVPDVPFGECDRELLELARRNIDEQFALVMLTERFDESVLLLRRMFGWKAPCYVNENISKKQVEVSPAARALIEERNALDVELYRHCAERFDEVIREQGDHFRRERVEFRTLNHFSSRWLKSEVVWPD